MTELHALLHYRSFATTVTLLTAMLLSAEVGEACRAGDRRADDDVVSLNNLSYREPSYKSCVLDLAMPREKADKLRSAIVVIHGGGWVEGDKSSFSVREKRPPGNIIDFAKLGFVAVTINYRMSGEAPYPVALDDCRCAVRWLRAHAAEYHVDPKRIGAFGNSAGGHLALLLGMTGNHLELPAGEPWRDQSSTVQAVVSDSGPIDLAHQYEQGTLRTVVSKFMGGPPAGDLAARYRQASPMTYVSRAGPPLLLIYGVADNQVPVGDADRFVTALGQAGATDVSYHRLAAVDHCPYSLQHVVSLKPVVDEFFLRALAAKR